MQLIEGQTVAFEQAVEQACLREPSLVASQVQASWAALLKWVRVQLDQDRIVSAHNLCLFLTSSLQTAPTLWSYLTPFQSARGSLPMYCHHQLKPLPAYPAVGIHYAGLQKQSGIDRKVLQASLTAVFQIFAHKLSLKSVTLDFDVFGKLRLRDRKVTTVKRTVRKAENKGSKPTVKELIEHSRKLPKIQMEKPPSREVVDESRNNVLIRKRNLRGRVSSLFSKDPVHNESNLTDRSGAEEDSPTRRFNRKDVAIKKDLLGAGIDPLTKEQDFSIHARHARDLMGVSFLKPPNARIRYPPILDYSARTIAAPISSVGAPIPLLHKIGSNFSLGSKGLVLSTQSKCVAGLRVEVRNTFDFIAEYLEPIASEGEQIQYVCLKDYSLERRVQAKLRSYERYQNYIEHEIARDQVAQMRKYWVTNIFSLLPERLPHEEYSMIVDDCLLEVSSRYYSALKKSILDYVLLDERERRRLGLVYVDRPAVQWGEARYQGQVSSQEERAVNLNTRETLEANLVSFNPVTWQILHEWQNKFLPQHPVLCLPADTDRRLTVSEFLKTQAEHLSRVKGRFTDFIATVADIYQQYLPLLGPNQALVERFYEANAVLLSGLLRKYIENGIRTYTQFILRLTRKRIRPVDELIREEKERPETHVPETAFLTIALVEQNCRPVFTTSLHTVKDSLLKVLDEIVRISTAIARPEERAQPKFLPEFPSQSPELRKAVADLSPAIDSLLAPLQQHLQELVLPPALSIPASLLGENPLAPTVLKALLKEFQTYDRFIKEIDQIPQFCVARLVELDYLQLKHKCEERVKVARQEVGESLLIAYKKRCGEIAREYQQLQQTLHAPIQDVDRLVFVQKYIQKVRKVTEKKIKNDYEEAFKCLYFLMNRQVRATEDEYRLIHSISLNLLQLPKLLTEQENRAQQMRQRLEEQVNKLKDGFTKSIVEYQKAIQQLRKYSGGFQTKMANSEVDDIVTKGQTLTADLQEINRKEELLGFQVTDFPKLEQAISSYKPFQDLWRLARRYYTQSEAWNKTIAFNLDAEAMDKEVASMNSAAIKLYNLFNSDYERDLKSGKKRAPLEGPNKMIETLKKEIASFKECIPVALVFSNPGMRERHWEKAAEHLGVTINREHNWTLKKVMDIENILGNIKPLGDISDEALKEYGIQNIMNKMLADWQPVNVELKAWKDTGSYIVAGGSVDEIQQILDDQLVKTQTMKGSPFAKIFEKRITDWEDWLNYTLEFTDIWVKVQGVWVYLEPIFSSPDITKHLPNEAVKFREVDQEWKLMMAVILEKPQVLEFTQRREFLASLRASNDKLEMVQKGLNAYLEGKRAAFPRFYFLSNDELLQILSETKDPMRVQPHLKKCFQGIQRLKIDDQKKVYGMYSSEGEYVNYLTIIDTNAANGNVDQWLLWTEGAMIEAVRDVTFRALADYTKHKREDWVQRRCGMAVLCISMTFWTQGTQRAIEGGQKGIEEYHQRLDKELKEIVGLTRKNITPLDRCTIEALIVLDVHNRDVLGALVEEHVQKASQFTWQSQLRYYWENDNTWVRIINALMDFNYEYLGNSARLVITPLTDRCYRTLCGALHLNYGGAPEGPAGTGKTQTVKDLAKALARQCVVFNCSDGLDYKAMGKFFKGLASSGAWSCFDEFNRIDLEVLSVVAQQILTIQLARGKHLDKFFFEDADIPLKKTCNVFITMNPGYAGRSELPDNLKALFRAVAMMVPDYAMIAEISLYSYGFDDARNLARKIVTTYKLCSEQLSSQDHYDYGMRAVKSVLTAAGNLKRKYTSQDESILMLRAINDVNLAKFLAFDLPLFQGITSDLFPGVSLPQIDYRNMHECIRDKMAQLNLQSPEYFLQKLIQLYEMILVRHGLMVVGWPFAAKSTCIKVLAGALTLLCERGQMGENKTQICCLNPKSISMKQLYGFNDQISHQWTDGVLAVKFRGFAKAEDPDRKWLVFDGPVDAVWIENMNTVLDDNKKLCLNSGQIIAMSRSMNMIFEPMDLLAASPATVSRNGMVYMEPASMGWRVLFDSWLKELPSHLLPEDLTVVTYLFTTYVDPLLTYVRGKVSEISPSQDQNLVVTLLRQFSSLIRAWFGTPAQYAPFTDPKNRQTILEANFVFAVTWSLGGSADTSSRKSLDVFIKKLLGGGQQGRRKLPVPERSALFDSRYDKRREKEEGAPSGKTGEWTTWLDWVDLNEKIPNKTAVQEIMVKTNDTVRYSYFLKLLVVSNYPVLFCGPTGTGKSVYIKQVIAKDLGDEFSSIQVGFSAQTSAMQTQYIIDSKLDRKRKGYFGPQSGRCVLFIDDLNMPAKEKWGAQPPIQLVRQFLDQGGWYDNRDKEKPFRNLVNIVLVCAMGPPGGGRTFVSPRLLRHLSLISLTSFEDDTMIRIFTTLLHYHLTSGNFSADAVRAEPKVIQSTLQIYKAAIAELLPTPAKSHYLFNLRDYAKVIYGVCMSDKERASTAEQFVRLWAHQSWRVFADRLVNEQDRKVILERIRGIVDKVWGLKFDTVFSHLDKQVGGKGDGKVDTVEEIRSLMWSDCMCPVGAKRVYQEILDYTRLQQAIEEALVNYNLISAKPMDLVLFNFAIEHLLVITRILKQAGGNALLVGVGGSGRQSLTRLGTSMMDYQIFQIQISKTYGKAEWKEDLKRILKNSGAKNTPSVFLFTDSEIKDESFVQDLNNLLNTYQVPNLFPADQKAQLLELVRPVAKAEGKAEAGTPAQLYSFFVEKCKKNLHVVLGFSPIGDALRTRVRMFPSLVNCCTIDWFQEWPQDALLWVARRFLNEVEMQAEIRQMCVQMVQFFHESTAKWAALFQKRLKRKYYVTPTSYIQLITTFKNLLAEKRQLVKGDALKYENGYTKIIVTENTVNEMQKNLTQLQPKLKVAAEETQVKMKEVAVEKEQADKLKQVIQGEERIVKVAVDEANFIKEECQKELAEAMPALESAIQALKVLDKKQIDLLKKMLNPPKQIKFVMQALCLILYPNPTEKVKNPETLKIETDWWAASIKLLNKPGLLEELVSYKLQEIPEVTVNSLTKYLFDPAVKDQIKVQNVEKASTACKCIIMWINGVYNFYFVNKKVKPKKEKLAESEAKVSKLNAELAVKQKQLKTAVDKVDNLSRQLQRTIDNKLALEQEYDDCSRQLVRAKQLIQNLGGEKGRWGQLAKILQVFYDNLTGDILVSAGLIAYLGAFTSAFRAEITKEWVEACRARNIPSSEKYSLEQVLGNPVRIREWNIQGLPSDSFSIENGIIIFKARRWPLCIDPQGQANKWIKRMEAGNKLNVIKLSDPDFLRTLENSIQFGRPVLLQNVGEELDPALNPVLLKQTFQKGSTLYIKLGDQTIQYSANFRFYITTKHRNPHYLPQISTKVTIINFMITLEGLNDQLLGILVKKERPDLQDEKQRLILQGADNKKQLFQIQQKILKVLSSDKNILKDEEAIQILTASKVKSNQIKEKQEIAQVTQKNIDDARQEYQPVSQEAACLFFAISDLANIDPMYQYSLAYYIQLFTQSISKSEKSNNLPVRLKNLRNYFLYSLYSNICRSLFEKDKLLFSFLLSLRLLQHQKRIDLEQVRFLLTGGVALSEQLPSPPPASPWLSDRMWGEICRLSKLQHYQDFVKSFHHSTAAWLAVYNAVDPHKSVFPKPIDEYSQFMKLLTLRTIRPDKLIPAVQDFVCEELGERFISPPAFDLAKIYGDSTSTTPLIFILSPGSDPFASLNVFSSAKKKKISSISLGQGQGPLAQKMISEGQKSGDWVVLQNCHLAVTWMPTLQKICQELSPDPEVTHADFRLWLTSYPSDKFPQAILQNGVKMTNEPPKGLKANLMGSFLTDPISSEEFFGGNTTQPQNFRSLVYALCFFHAVIQERRKYGPLGWNIPYEFNESDLRISVRQIKMFLDENETGIPFAALKYLVAECNYGGRVTDDKDRRLITTLLDDYFNEQVLELDGYCFAAPDQNSLAARLPSYEDYLQFIRELPLQVSPNVFGFHANADITKDINETNLLLDSLILCSSQSSGDSGGSSDGLLKRLAQSIMADFPKPYDIDECMRMYPVVYSESMNTVLTQELTRFNHLIRVVRSSLSDITLALDGKILMSPQLEAAAKSLLVGKIPDLWMAKSYPSLKPLSSYVTDLRLRLQFFQKWIDQAAPHSFWISGFFFTQSFLTGVLQNYARKYTIPIDQIVFDYEILPAPKQEKPQDGAQIYGLFIEGARWNYQACSLDESEPKCLFVKCPSIWLKPAHLSKVSAYQHYNCPVYKTSARRGVLSTTGHSTNFVMLIRLPSRVDQRHWIKRGVALLTQLDD